MSEAILMSGGTGGVGSDEVTASKSQVLKGYKTITSDSDDEIVEGEMVNRGTWNMASEVVDAPWENNVHTRFEEGYYHKDGNFKPTAKIPYAVLSNVLGIDANKMLSNLTIAGITGKIKMINTQDNDYSINKSTAFGIDFHRGKFWINFPHGNAYYHRADNYPHTCIDADNLGNATADRVVAGSTFTSKNGVNVQGQIPDRGVGQVVSYLQGREDWANRIRVLFKNGWYHRNPWDDGQGHIHEAFVYVTYEQLKNLFGIDANQMLQGYVVAGVQGAIPRWVGTHGDVVTAHNVPNYGQGFAWDDTTPLKRGRGIIVGIPNGHFIQGANWAFLPSPNLYPWNIREGVNIHGIVGTMKDTNAGRVVFNNATFDGTIASGVANKGFYVNNVYYAYSLNQNYGYAGIGNGGMNFNQVIDYATRSKRIGCMLSHSIDLTPFRQIIVDYRTLARIQGEPYTTLEILVNRVSTRRFNYTAGVGNVDSLDGLKLGIASYSINRVGQIVLDVSNINEQAFIGFGAYCDRKRDSDVILGAVQITRIEFKN